MPSADSDRWLADLYPELHTRAQWLFASEPGDHTLQATALVHEAFLRLRTERGAWQSRAHFLGVAATTMRRVLVDHARRRGAERRGGGWCRIPLDDGAASAEPPRSAPLADLDRALATLAGVHPAGAQLVELRFFLGLSMPAIARELSRSERSLRSDWAFARAFLHRALSAERSA